MDDFPRKTPKVLLASQSVLRILVIALTLTAICLTFTAKQTVEFLGIEFSAKYSYSPAFRYFVSTNIVVVVLSIISLLFLFIYAKSTTPYRCYTILVCDFIATVLGVSGCAAAASIGYVGRYGNEHSGWSPICDYVDKFCNRIQISLICSGLGLILLVVLTFWSAIRITKLVTISR
ncbi:hypothetical protein MKW92_040557 [Papaver armeniacum]|nr:hypothetical protein MKW92_040557 [Papaver armeniacum]